MERGIHFPQRPQPMEWGNKKIVPLNIVEVSNIDENGNEVKGYRSDLVPKVEQPLTVENIVKAAIDSEYGDAAQKRITQNLALNKDDEEAQKFKAFVSEVTEAAKAEGYE